MNKPRCALASDQAWNEITLPDLTAMDWRTAAANMATDLHAMLTRHPWLEFGLQAVLDGLQARLVAQRAPATP